MEQGKQIFVLVNYSAKHILLIINLFLATMSFGQVQTQKGVSYRYNGKNPRTPLPNVTIECDMANNTAISDSTGSFTLVFNKLKMGDRMGLVTVKKREMMVFNQQAVDEWSIRKEPLCLILCDANEFENQKQNLIEIGKREAQKKYNREKADLEARLNANEIQRTEYENALDQAYEQLERLQKNIAEYADALARIDRSELDSQMQEVLEIYESGQVEEAIKKLDEMKLDKQFEQVLDRKQFHQLGLETAIQDSALVVSKIKDAITLYKNGNEWEKAAAHLKLLADRLNTVDDIFAYALFCQGQNAFDEAETYYLKALPMVRQLAKENPQAYEPYVALTLTNLASLYSHTQRLTESETLYLEALDIHRRLAQANPQAYEPDVALTLNNLASLYNYTQRLDESEALFLEALGIYRRLAKSNPQAYEPYVAGTLDNLASLYKNTQRLTESETLCLEALDIYRRLAKANPKAYEPDVALTLNNFASLYNYTQRLDESEALFLEALDIYRRLAKANPKAYEPYVAGTLDNLASLYNYTQRLDESEALFLEALDIYRRLAKANPKAYEPDVALTLNNLASLYNYTQRLDESEALFLEVLGIYRRLAKSNPQAYEPYVAGTLDNLASLYNYTQRLDESEALFLEALDIYRRLAKANPKAYEPDLAQTLYNMGLLCLQQEQYLQAIPAFEEALTIYRRWVANNPSYFNNYFRSLYWLSQLYPMTENLAKCYEINEEWLPILKRYYQEDAETWQEEYIKNLDLQSLLCLLIGQTEKSEQYAREALAIDSTQHWICANLAASLLFQGKYDEAEIIYRQYKEEMKDSFLKDLNDFESAGVIPEERKADVEKIRKLLLE